MLFRSRGASEARPLLITLEDMHWGDMASWDALEYVLTQLTTERICIALTIRSEEAAYGAVRERRQRITRDERVRELRLERLTADEVREWLQGALHRTDLGDDLLDFVLRHTEGNAFLIMQLMRTMVEEQVFTYTGVAWEWAIPAAVVLPAGMTDLIGRRLSRLPPDALRVLVTAAALGRTFSLPMLIEASGAGADSVLDAIDAALATSVLEPAREQEDDTYQFAHALLVDAVFKSVSPARRKLTHERIANILVVRTPDAVDRIASHYARSSNAALAYVWCRRAATSAMALYALDESAEFLQHALTHASTDDERALVHDQLAQAAEHAGRWADVERSCDAILATPGHGGESVSALPVHLRRLQARVRLGQAARDTEAECSALLLIAERVGSTADVVQTRSLLVQTLARVGKMDDAIRIAEESLHIAEESGDVGLACGAMHRLSITLLPSRTEDAVVLLNRLIERTRERDDRVMEARAGLTLGVALMRLRDDIGGAEALRSALTLAQDAQALDVAASASMNLGVIGMRSGDFTVAHEALSDALRLYTTLRNNANRLAALNNLANLQQERGDAEAALSLYRETTTLADQLGTEDIAIGAYAGAGLAAFRLRDIDGAEAALDSAQRRLGSRQDWWFQKRELLESLAIRLDARAGRYAEALARFHSALPSLEESDGYAAAWMVADCAAELGAHDRTVWTQVARFAGHPMVQQFVPLSARFTALVDMVDRMDTAYLRAGDVSTTAGGA